MSIVVELASRYSKQASAWEDLRRVVRTLENNGIQQRDEPDPLPAPRNRVDQRISAETAAQLVAEYESGTSSNQLVRDFNLGKGSVLRLLREAGVAVRNQSLSPEQIAEAIAHYESGLSLKDVGGQMGASIDTVRSGLMRAGVQLRPRPGWNYEA